MSTVRVVFPDYLSVSYDCATKYFLVLYRGFSMFRSRIYILIDLITLLLLLLFKKIVFKVAKLPYFKSMIMDN